MRTDKSAANDVGLPRLHRAVMAGAGALAVALSKGSSDIERRNVLGDTAVQVAIRRRQPVCVRLLVAHGARIRREMLAHLLASYEYPQFVFAGWNGVGVPPCDEDLSEGVAVVREMLRAERCRFVGLRQSADDKAIRGWLAARLYQSWWTDESLPELNPDSDDADERCSIVCAA